MTRIDFHSDVADKIAYTCRLTRKAWAAGCKIVIHSTDETQLKQLDEALWTFSAQDFLPHVMAGDALAVRTPVILAHGNQEVPHHEVLINLSPTTPEHFARFQRLLEIVSSSEPDKLAGRERFRFYKERGYPLEHHVAGKS